MATSRDYYELLDVPKTAAYEDIKTAYKRQALQWHPDKNSDRLDEATERFKAINEAYKVLSDPRERAWYDTHKDQILSGESEDSGINLWPYFSPSAYPAGYTDEPEGFYAVFREVFETVSREENTQASDKSDIQQRPGFGDSTTPIEQVSEFYNHWTNFTTIKKFFWADKYDLRDGEHRRIRRLMEAENKKERGKEKRAYVEMVRELAEHVKRRDPRWTEYQTRLKIEREAKQAAEMQQKQEESKRLKELKEQFRREEAERYKREYEEMRRKQIEEEGGEGASDDEEEEEEEPFFCEPCKKAFSTEKQLHNHEQSKKHKQKLQQIRAEVILPEEQPEVVKKPPPPKPSKAKEVPKVPEEEVKAMPEQESSSEGEEEEPVASRFMMRRKETSDDEDELPVPPVPQPTKGKKPTEESKQPQEEQKKVGKAKLKRQKKSEKAAGPGMCCNICGQKFDTRNKLFTHIKETGHAATR